ncbi:MAG: hypothetical protein ACQERB_10030 [Promethearchaeati archaeon]|nr:MAG: hypothetical protein EU543_04700 [Candidatus Lokiarchaeota archaeon]
MGFSLKELTYKDREILYLTEQEYAGPWFSFKMHGKKVGTVPVILKNIEPTPIYKLVNSRKGTYIDRITLDFDIQEYLKELIKNGELVPVKFKKENPYIRLYIDIFSKPKVPYINTFFTFKNISDYNLIDFNIYFVFDFDINGLQGFDNDLSGYDKENDIIYQYDKTGLYAGFSPISRSTHYETTLTKNFHINQKKLNLSDTLYDKPGEILSALQIEFKTLEPQQTFQTALSISGGLNKEELFDNINKGKKSAYKFIVQVNRNVKSKFRNKQEEAFIKINEQKSLDCGK